MAVSRNPRLDLARQLAQQSGSSQVQTFSEVLRNQSLYTAGGLPTVDPFADATAGKQKDVGGWKGFLTDVLESPVGKVVSKAGEILSAPQRVVASTINELKDALDSDPNTVASWNEFTSQVADPTFGFGKVVGDITPWSWANRLIGFVGDVVTDPLTYVTFGASKAMTYADDIADIAAGSQRAIKAAQAGKRGLTVSGREGRVALAARLRSVGASDDVVLKAARYGRAAVKDVQLLERAGVNRAGLYWFGRRVPGTTAVGGKLENAFSSMRVWSGDHVFKRAAAAFTPEDAKAARIALARGTVSGEEGIEFIEMVLSRNAERAAIGEQTRVARAAFVEALSQVGDDNVETLRNVVYRMLDVNPRPVFDLNTPEGRMAQAVDNIFQSLWNNVETSARAVDPDAPVPRIISYWPHMPTEDAYRWLANDANSESVKLRALLYNPLENTGSFKQRMEVGDDWFGVKLTQDDIDQGIDRLNQIAREKGGLKFDFFETDAINVLDRYADMYGAQMGRIARKKYLVDKGVYKKIERRLVTDPDRVKQAQSGLRKAVKGRRNAQKKVISSFDALLKEFDRSGAFRRGELADTIGFTSNLGDKAVALRMAAQEQEWLVVDAQRTLDDAIVEFEKHRDAYVDFLLAEEPESLRLLEARYDESINRLKKLRDDIAKGRVAKREMAQRITDSYKEIAELLEKESSLVDLSDAVQRHLDDIIEGRLSGKDVGISKSLQDSLTAAMVGRIDIKGGADAVVRGGTIARDTDLYESIVKQVRGTKKNLSSADRAEIVRLYEEAGGEWDVTTGASASRWWMETNTQKPVNPTEVARAATVQAQLETVQRAIRGEASLTELRTAAMALLATTDTIPKSLRDTLVDVLRRADAADRFRDGLQNLRRTNKQFAILEQRLDNWTAVQREITYGIKLYADAEYLLDTMFNTGTMRTAGIGWDEEVAPEIIDGIIGQMPSMEKILGNYRGTLEDIEDIAGMTQAIDFGEVDPSGNISIRSGTKKGPSDVLSGGQLASQRAVGAGERITYGEMFDLLKKTRSDLYEMEREVVFSRKGPKGTTVDKVVRYRMADVLAADPTDPADRGWSASVRGHYNPERTDRFIDRIVSTSKSDKDVAAAAAKRAEFADPQEWFTKVSGLRQVAELNNLGRRTPGLKQIIGRAKVDARLADFLNGRSGSANISAYRALDVDLEKIEAGISTRLRNLSREMAKTPDDPLKIALHDDLRAAAEAVSSARRAIADVSMPTRGVSRTPRRVTGAMQTDRFGTAGATVGVDEFGDAIDVAGRTGKEVRVGTEAIRNKRGEIIGERTITADIPNIADEIELIRSEMRTLADDIKITSMPMGRARIAAREVGEGLGTAEDVKAARIAESIDLQDAWSAETKQLLEDTYQKAWFAAEVQKRFKRASDVLLANGLTPDVDFMRHIMNVVAKVFRNQLLSSQDDYSEALLVLGRLKATAENWGGDASELYHIMSEALNPVDAGGNLASWGQIVRNANGREDAQRLLATFKDYGGATNSGGFNSRRRWAERIIADPASTPERVALAKQRLAALPTKEKVAAGRKALKKELQKWYQQNVDSTRRAASWTEIETALQQYSAVARGRGRFTEGASVRSLRAWVESTEEAVRKAYANARQRTGWLSASADPYLSTEAANKILLGISDRTIAWDLPSFFASTMRTLADEYEARVLELGGAQQRAAARAGALSAEESAEALAKRKIVALEAKTSKPIKGFADAEQREVLKQFNVDELKELARDKGIEGYSKMSRASLEDALIAVRVDELDEARLIQKKLTQLKNTDEFAIALEQIRENDVLRILSSFNVDKPNTELVIREGAKKRTLRLLNEGQQIFRKDVSDAGEQYVQITKAREIKDGVQYYYKTKSPSAPYELIGDGAPKSLGVKFSPEEWSALWRGDSRRFVNAETNRFVMLQDELTEVRRQMEELSGVLNRSGVASYPPSELRRFGERMIVLRRRERNIAQKMYSIVGAEEGGVVLESLDFSAAARRAGEVHASAWEKFNLIVDAVRNGEIDINDLQNGLFTSVRKIDTKRQISVKRIVGQGAGHGGYDVIQGTDEAAGVITRVSFDSKRVASAADWEIADRAKMIDKSWSDSPNRLVYEQVQELEQDAASKLFNREMKNAESVLKRVRELRDKAEKAVAFKAEEGAPLGRYYDPSSRSWVVRRDLTEGAMIYNMQEGRVVPRNVQVAENRLATADALVAKRLEEVTASTARAGEPDYNAAERYAYFRSQDQSPTVAMDNVVDELRALRPSDERLVQIAGTKERLQRAEALRSSIPTMEYLSEGIALRLTFAEEEMATLKKLVPSLEKEMTKGKKTYLRERGKEAARLQKNIEKARTVVQRAESALSEAEGAYKTARLDAWRTEEWYKAWHARMAPKLEEIKSIVEAGAQGKEVAAGLSSASMRQAAMAEAQDWIDQVTTLMPELGMDADLVKTLQADYLAAQAMWLEAADEVDLYNQMLSPLNTTSWASKVVEDFDKGLVKLTQIGLPNYVARQSIVEMTENFHRLRAPEFVRGLNRLIGRYTGFFKASAVGTPGFVVRNTMSNTFMLVAAGGNPKTLFDGLGLFQAWKQAVSNGTERAWLDSLPAARRSVVETSIRAMDASGFGRGAEALNQWAPRGKFWTDNKYYRFIRRANETSEGSARFMLAYDTVMRGGSFDEATARVKRFLFDYTDISNADATIRSIVPFWFWMSRNFPLQIVNRWANPRAYNVYQSALRNLGIDEDADTNVPKWLRTQGAFPIGGDYYFAPDFGLSRVEQHLEELKDPKRLLAYVNPLLRVVPEVALMDKMMYRDVPFSERPQQPVGGPLAPAVQALAGLLGQSKRGREGEGVSEKLNYALMGLFPPIGQAERLLPATDLYEGRQTGSILSYLGVPVRQVTEEQREREERRQRREGE